jgi:tRNA G46 methylase TrmB
VPGGELRVVTDHDGYWAWMQERFERVGAPGPASEARFEVLPFGRARPDGDGELVGTNFERKYRREGRPFHAAVLRKREVPALAPTRLPA